MAFILFAPQKMTIRITCSLLNLNLDVKLNTSVKNNFITLKRIIIKYTPIGGLIIDHYLKNKIINHYFNIK